MPGHDRVLFRLTQAVWYALYVVETFLVLRFALKLFGADQGAVFTNIVYTASSALLQPFKYMFGVDNAAGSIIEWSTLLAMFVYWLVAWGVTELIAMNRSVTTSYEARHGWRTHDII